MANYTVADIRDIAFCGHGAAGKTTLLDTLLFKAGAVTRQGSVDEKNSVCDFDEEEKHHKYTIEAKAVHLDHAGKRFYLLDTPGYADFIGQSLGALAGVDTVVITINAHSGIEVNTRRMFAEATKLGLGRIVVINKMDVENVDYPKLLESIKELWGNGCVPLNVPVGHGHDFKGVIDTLHLPQKTDGALIDPVAVHEALIESIVEVDEAVTERYFEGIQPTEDEIKRLIVQAVQAGSLIPVLCTSAKLGIGLPELLNALSLCALPPGSVHRKVTDAEGNNGMEVTPDPNGPLVAQVFKTRIDPFVQKLSFIRVHSGTLKKDQTVMVSGERKPVKITQLLNIQADKTEPITQAIPGDIVAVAKAEDLHTGRTLGELVLEMPKFPTPMVGLAAVPKARGDEAKLSGALHKIVEEDPTFRIDRDPQTKELVMMGNSDLHLQILRERLHRRDKVDVDTHEPKIPYRETIQAKAEGSYRHKKQSGGRGQFGEVHIRMQPLPRGTDIKEFCNKHNFPSMRAHHYDDKHNFLWVDSIVGGSIPNNFLPAIEKGFKERIERGVIAGFSVQNVCVDVHFGKYHDVDSSEAAFKTAGSMAFRDVFQQAKPCLLEPIVHIHITVPTDKLGDISSDLSSRRGRPQGLDSAGGNMQTVHAEIPLSEVTTYARALSSMTGGQGSYTMEFSHYDVVPGNVQKEIVDKAHHMKEEEE